MRKKFTILVMVLMLVPTILFAEEAQDKEKPVKKEKITAGYDSGFVIRSADEAFSLKFGGLHQVLYSFETKERGEDSDLDNTRHSFELNRSRITYGIKLYEKFDLYGYYNYSTGKSVSWTIFSSYIVSPALKIGFGLAPIPFDFYGPGSSAGRSFIEKPASLLDKESGDATTIATKTFGHGFDLGLTASGGIGRFSYVLGMANGNGYYNINTNAEFVYGAQLTYDILEKCTISPEYDFYYSEKPHWTIGAGALFQDDDTVDKLTQAHLSWAYSMTAGSLFKYKGFAFNAEGYYRLIRVSDPGTAVVGSDGGITDIGYYMMPSYFLIPKTLEIAGIAAQIFREGADNNIFQFGGALNWYPLKVDKIKWQLTYDYTLDYDEIAGLDDQSQHYLRTQITIKW